MEKPNGVSRSADKALEEDRLEEAVVIEEHRQEEEAETEDLPTPNPSPDPDPDPDAD